MRSGRDYDPRLGFTLRHDFTQLQNNIQYLWFVNPASPLRTITVGNRSSTFIRNTDRTVESAAITSSLEFEFKSGSRLELTLENSYESVLDSFLLSGVTPVVAGNYWFHEGQLQYMRPRSAQLRGGATVRAGSFYDGWRVSASGGPTWSASRHLELGGNYQVDHVEFSKRNESLTAHLTRFRIQVALDIHLSATALFQYSSTTDRLGVNARLRYHFREGSDLWLVYNDDMNTDRHMLGRPRLPLSQARTLMLKYTLTFVP